MFDLRHLGYVLIVRRTRVKRARSFLFFVPPAFLKIKLKCVKLIWENKTAQYNLCHVLYALKEDFDILMSTKNQFLCCLFMYYLPIKMKPKCGNIAHANEEFDIRTFDGVILSL